MPFLVLLGVRTRYRLHNGWNHLWCYFTCTWFILFTTANIEKPWSYQLCLKPSKYDANNQSIYTSASLAFWHRHQWLQEATHIFIRHDTTPLWWPVHHASKHFMIGRNWCWDTVQWTDWSLPIWIQFLAQLYFMLQKLCYQASAPPQTFSTRDLQGPVAFCTDHMLRTSCTLGSLSSLLMKGSLVVKAVSTQVNLY